LEILVCGGGRKNKILIEKKLKKNFKKILLFKIN
jgi:1,6-anhydro-N-acetylmuramate kinase